MKHLHSDAIALKVIACIAILAGTVFFQNLKAQCPSPCGASSFNEGGTVTPIANSVGTVNVGAGTFVNVNVHNGGRYILSHCSTPTPFGTNNTQLSLYNYASGSACVAYNDNPGGACGNRAVIDYTSGSNGVLQLQSNRNNCLGFNGTSGALTYQCIGPGDTTVYGNGYWNLYAWNAGDANGNSGAWSSGYSGYMSVNSLSFNTTSYWPVLGSPSNYSGYLGCEVGVDYHSWSAKRTGFDCGIYSITVDNHDDLIQVIVNGSATTLTGTSGTPTVVYTGLLNNSSLVIVRGSEGPGNSNASITLTNITTTLNGGDVGVDQTVCSPGDPATFNNLAGASGGAGGYNYQWYSQTNCTGGGSPISGANGTTYNPPAGLSNTTCYFRSVTDACGNAAFTASTQVTVNQPPTAAASINASPSSNICNPTLVSLNAAGGNPGTGGAWTWYANSCGGAPMGTGISINVSPSSTTTYFVRAEGSGPCSYPTACTQRTITVNQPSTAPTSLSATPSNSCAGGNVVLSASGASLGTGANYVWYEGGASCGAGVQIASGTSNSITVTPTTTTTYWVRVEGPPPCATTTACATTTVTVNTNSTAPTGVNASTDTLCNGAGSSILTVQGGSLGTGASWVWYANGCGLGASVGSGPSIVVSPSSTTTYFVRAETTGGNPCSSPTACASKQIFVKQNSTAASSISGTLVVCNGVSTTLSVLGGSLGWGANWQWYSGSCGGAFVGSGTSITVSPNTTTTYFVRAEGQCNTTSCVFTTVTVNDTSQPATSILGPAYICFGSGTNLTVNGGFLGTSANWRWYSGSCGGTLEGTGAVLPVAPISTTTYFVQAVGLCNTTICTQFTLPVNPLPQGNISGSTDICAGFSTNITFNFTTGTGPFNIVYTDGTNSYPLNGVNNGDVVTVTPGSTTTYQFTSITDALGCVRTTLFGGAATVTINPLPDINSVTPTPVLCNGGSTGSITILASNGTPQLTYSIDSGLTTQTSNVFNNLYAGFYNIAVIDAEGCSRHLPGQIQITEPTPLVQTSTTTDASCANVFDGKIDVFANGGVLPYSYSLNGGPTQAGSQFTGLSAGNYVTYVYDANGCLDTAQITINNSYAITSAIDSQYNVSCFGGSDGLVIVELTGGIPAYMYSINGSIFVPSPIFTGLSAGSYIVTLRDSKGCTDFLPVTITQPTQLSVTIDQVQNVGCNGASTGAIFVTASGGTAPYSFNWSNGDTLEDADTLIAGTYTVTITDSKGCATFGSATVSQPIPLFVSVASYKDLKCFNDSSGTIDVTVNGGVPPYSYLWNTGETSEDLANLDSATYTLTVTDVNGCQQVVAQAIDQPDILASTISQSPVSCNGLSDGNIDLTVTGGTGPYSYFWNNGATTEDLSSIPAGNYNVLITDAKGCATTNSIQVTQPTAIVLSVIVTNVSCFGGNNGAVTLTVTGGAGGNTFLWNTSDTTQSLSGVTTGVYTVQVTDQNGCTASINATVTQPSAALSATADSTDVSCFGANNGQVDVTVTGGTQPYSYLWSNGATTQDVSGLGPNTYSVTITDANGCGFTISSFVNEPQLLTATITPTHVSCNGGSNGAADLTVSGGNPGYTYLWNNFATTEDLSGLTAGNYTVIVTDTKNCQVIASTTITQFASLSITGSVTNVSCYGGSDAQVQITTAGGTGTYSYLWSNTSTAEDQTGLTAGNYIVVATDGNNCTASAAFTVTQPDTLTVTGVVTHVNCNGNANGAVNITVAGGTVVYSYLWSNGTTTQDLNGLSGGTFTVTVTDAQGCVATGTYTVNEPTAITSTITPTHVTCGGAANGAADLTPGGGTPPYNFLWSNFSSNEDISGLSGGEYFVIITDANGCAKRDSVTILEPTALVLSVSDTAVLCFGGSNGAVNLTVSGGTVNYTYIWSNGAITEDLSGLTAGTYSVTVTDANGCQASVSVVITQPTAVLAATTVATDVTCFGSNNGSVNLTVTGGTTAYTFAWSNGATTEDITGLGSNTYTVTVTDANACVTVASAFVDEPVVLSASIGATPVSCFGGSDGEADLTVNGGNPGYTYLWSNFATTEDITGLTAGNYVVIVTDAKGCSVTAGTTITQPSQLVVTGAVVNIQCNGGNNGSINLTVVGGTTTYSYLWSNGANTPSISGITAGGYSVTVTDANLCNASASFTVTEPAALTISSSSIDVTCNGMANGTVNIAVAGGTTPYSYLWNNGATTQNLSGLSGGTYFVTITDANGCITATSVTVNEPTAITSSIAKTDATCSGFANGEADLTVSNGTPPYTFLWSTFQNTEDISGLSGGWYYVIIKDANGCEKRDSVFIDEPAPITITVSDTDVLCNGAATGTINITVNGGTPTITYLWSNGATTEDVTSLAAGTYSVTLTDGNGCTASASAAITEPTGLVLNATTTDVGCAGGANGSVDVTVQGGVFPYSFAWSNGATTEDINNVSGGTYSVTITDANGCVLSDTFDVNEPIALTSSITPTHLLCNGANTGAADLQVSGGTSPYSFLWSNFAGTEDLTGLAGGYYVVVITDANGCTRRDSVVINEPTAIAIATTVTNVACNGGANGEVDITVTGGTPGYTYLWSNGATTDDLSALTIGTYTLTVTDANGCTASVAVVVTQPSPLVLTGFSTNISCSGGNNGTVNTSISGGVSPYAFVWSNGSTTEDLTALAAGTYTLTVTDANSCTVTASYTLTEPSAITSSIAGTDVDCNGAANGVADLTPGGGVPPYTFLWNLFQTTEDLQNLSGGTYYVIITDANGCTKRDSVIISEPTKLVLSATSNNILCNGSNNGSIDLSVVGGTPNYSYLWSNGAVTEDISGLTGGTYTVTVTDFNGCTATMSVFISQPVVLLVTGNGVDVSCNGGNNGSVNINVSGGTAPYFYNWNNGETSEDIYNLTAGTYAVTVSDVNGCNDTASFTITAPGGMQSTVSTVDVSCQGANNGSADLFITGGTPPYTFLWSNFQGSEDIANLDGGIYYVLVTDDNGCTHRDSAIILEPSPLILSTVVVNISCFNANDGTVNLTVQGGTQPYTYAWSHGANTEDLSNLSGGTYVVTVTDNHGCTAQASVIIVNPSPIAANHITKNTLCFGDANGSIDLIPTGGTPNFTFSWSNGATSEDVNNLSAGLYIVTITDSRNCTKLDSITITEPGALFTSGFIKNVSCKGNADGCLDITGYGGTLPYAFLWSTGQSTEDICYLSGGDYYVTVTDGNGCSVVSFYQISEPDSLEVTLAATNVSCFGGTNGTVSATPSGGVKPYEYLWSDFIVDSFRTNIGAGLYVILLTDSNGCHIFDSIRVTEPTALQLSGVTTNTNCFGATDGGVDISVTGGTAPYTYSWTNGAVSEDLSSVGAGTYTVTVTDANQCTTTATFTITQPTELILTLITDKPSCHGSKNGSIAVIASQGVPPYSYTWSTTPPQTTATAEDLGAGSYTVTVVDDNGCTASVTQVLLQPDSLEVTTTATNAKCFGSSTGSVEVFVTGGVSPFVYELNGVAQPTGSFGNLQPGNYLVVVNDVNGCEGRSQFTITAPSQVQVDLSATQQVILTGMQTTLIASASSTLPIIGYSWMPDSLFDFSNCANPQDCNNPLVAPRTTTIFTVTAYNSDSCSASDTITIYVNNEASAFIPTAFTPNNDGMNDRFEFDILGATNLDVTIFNRWGEKFFSNEAQKNGFGNNDAWDGTKNGKYCPEDTYVYRITVTYFDGEVKTLEGTVTLMR